VVNKDVPALGIDLGGTKISAALVQDSKVVGEPWRVPTPKGRDKIIEAVLELIEKFKKDHLIFGVGIATAGIVDPVSGAVVGSTGNLPGWEGTPLKTEIQAKTALRVHVENDANAAAFGEVCASPKLRDKPCVVTVTLGTGIGLGIVVDGKVFRGSHYASQGGHIKISMENRRRCTCGLWDCWEAYGAGRGLLATGHDMLLGVTDDQSRLAVKRDALTNQDILDSARDGEVLGQRMLEKWHEYVAVGMASIAHVLDPDVFVITGGMSKFVDYTLLREMVSDRTLPRVAKFLEIHPSLLSEAAGMVGAANLVIAAANEEEIAIGS
jgi:glucokinase